MSPLPEGLLERLKNRQAILVAGLGCSSLAGFPGWTELGKRMSERISDEADKKAVRKLLRHGQLAAAVALCRELVAEDAVAEVLRDAFPPSTAVPESLQALAQAPWRGVVTTAFDNLWASALAGDAELSGRTVLAGKAASLDSGHGRFLLQIFRNWSREPAKLWLGFTVLLTAHHFINYAQVVAGQLEAHCRSVGQTETAAGVEVDAPDWFGQPEAL